MPDTISPEVYCSPHIRTKDSTRQIMLDVVIALLPAQAISAFVFGPRSLVLTAISVLSCVLFETVCCLIMRRPVSIGDCSAVVTGILLAFAMPVSAPVWFPAAGAGFAIIITKQLFGGMGGNFLNPALSGHVFLLISFPQHMTYFTRVRTVLPLLANVDAPAGVTPLSVLTAIEPSLPVEKLTDLAMGMTPGFLGEGSTLALLAGGLYLLYRRVISWRIPVAFLGTAAAITYFYPLARFDPVDFTLAHLLTGMLVLGAVFMATDSATSPVTKTGQLIFGAGCGALTIFLRHYGAYAEGVPYAILTMNSLVFLIDRLTGPRRFGRVFSRRREGK